MTKSTINQHAATPARIFLSRVDAEEMLANLNRKGGENLPSVSVSVVPIGRA
jgi:hypothetical protein